MKEYKGKGVYGGFAIGRISIYKRGGQVVRRFRVEDTESEIKRFYDAKETALNQLKKLYETAVVEVGEANAAIFEIHQMMLEDLDYIEAIENTIRSQSVNSEYAVANTGDNFSKMFAEMDDDYMRARAADVKDVSERLLSVLKGENTSVSLNDEPSIIIADDLAPSETVQMDKEKVLSFVTILGSVNSHTAILARTMGIPSLVSTDIEDYEALDGKFAIVDGYSGVIYIEPDEEFLKEMKVKQENDFRKKELLKELKNKECVTLDNKKLMLYANIGNIKDLATVIQNDADGIGLFRSEFLYLENSDYPSEDEQFKVYKTVAETMAGKRVIIRTLDIGADKQAEYFGLAKEENPAMGMRAIRICLTRKEVFKTQLRALFRASVYGKIAIMYPMITSLSEIKRIKEIVNEVKSELKAEGIEYRDVEEGIMIETPAAAMISDILAKEVDFFSIGTNDLTQYTLAIDRQNSAIDEFYNPHHTAVLRMIKMVVENSHKCGIWTGICGELGADTSLTKLFLAMGIDELSVTPTSILEVKKIVRETNLEKEKNEILNEFSEIF